MFTQEKPLKQRLNLPVKLLFVANALSVAGVIWLLLGLKTLAYESYHPYRLDAPWVLRDRAFQNSLINSGKPEVISKTIALYQAAIDRSQKENGRNSTYTAQLYFELGIYALDKSKLNMALDCFSRAIEIDPNATAPRVALSKLYDLKKERGAERQEISALLSKHPNSEEGRQLLICWMQHNDPSAASKQAFNFFQSPDANQINAATMGGTGLKSSKPNAARLGSVTGKHTHQNLSPKTTAETEQSDVNQDEAIVSSQPPISKVASKNNAHGAAARDKSKRKKRQDKADQTTPEKITTSKRSRRSKSLSIAKHNSSLKGLVPPPPPLPATLIPTTAPLAGSLVPLNSGSKSKHAGKSKEAASSHKNLESKKTASSEEQSNSSGDTEPGAKKHTSSEGSNSDDFLLDWAAVKKKK